MLNYERQRFTAMKNRALTPASFRPKVKTANCDELAANTSRPIFIVGVGKRFLFFHGKLCFG
jgi:hypothetical protein